MLIREDRCTGCGNCLASCPVACISIKDSKAVIDHDNCIECGLCYRLTICPADAFARETEPDSRKTVKATLSDPLTEYGVTGITGRGTEEMKTNDVTEKIGYGEVGICVDVGRPNVGTFLADVEKLVMALAPLLKEKGYWFEQDNPVTSFIQDRVTGKFHPHILDIRVMSAIIEFRIPLDSLVQVVNLLEEESQNVNTVFTIGVIERISESEEIVSKKILEKNGYRISERGKINLGLGKRI
ncbi:MAG: 4Fe-4S dicluster domain-containing protein [Synergistales bacterium]|nr:4Fe-4S dicluster domain-containing protein [Synergistales bacterium]